MQYISRLAAGPLRSSSVLYRNSRTFSTLTADQQRELAAEVSKDVAAKQSLEAMIKDVGKFNSLGTEEIKQLWQDYHKSKPFALALEPLDQLRWIKVRERAGTSPFFVLPNVRAKGSYFVLVTESKDNFVLMTFLDDYKRMGANASPWCSLSLYPDVQSLTLCQVKFAPYLKREEARALAERWLEFYTDDQKYEDGVWLFNKKPEAFDFGKVFPETA